MRICKILAVVASVAVLSILSGCEDEDSVGTGGWYLDVRWEVWDVHFNHTVIRTYEITIIQSGNSVIFVREGETISAGEIEDDTISCTDCDGYGINLIHIDSAAAMHSVPAVEQLSAVRFLKIESPGRI